MKKQPLHNFKINQTVFALERETGEILEGKISDKGCAKGFKFAQVPLQARTIIPVQWFDGTYGAIHFNELKTRIQDFYKKK